jgi:long-chain fatty acid transport protein
MKSAPMVRVMVARVTLVVALVLPSGARGDLGSHFGMNPRSMGLGGAYVAVSDDLASLYYNPAGLVQLKGMTVGIGLLSGTPFLSEGSTSVPMPNELSYHIHVGVPLSGRLKEVLAFGASLNMPWGRHLETRLYRKQDPYFVLYDASVRMLQIRLGGALRIPWRPLRFLTVGAAVQVLGSMTGNIGFYAPYQRGDAGTDPDSRLEAWAQMEVPTTTFFVVGALAQLGDRWRLGVTYRSEQYIGVEIPISLNTRLATSEDLRIHIPVDGTATYRAKYCPQQVSLGASYQRRKLLLTADLTWINYGAFETPAPRVTLNTEKLKRDPGLQVLLGPDSLMYDPLRPRVQWKDVVVPRVGAEYALLKWLTARGGYFYERSPLQGTDFPIYDCDKHGFSLGARASFLRPLNLLPGWLHIDVSLLEILYAGRSILGSDVGGHVFGINSGIEIIFL